MKIAIQGHLTKGKEVIQILESLGGKSRGDLTGRICSQYYFINSNGDIDLHYRSNLSTYKLYTLEEFEEEFPFKVGDKVIHKEFNDFFEVISFDPESSYPYKIKGVCEFNTKSCVLTKWQPKMKEERFVTLSFKKAKEWYKKGGELREIALQAFTEKELNSLPKSWDEFVESTKFTFNCSLEYINGIGHWSNGCLPNKSIGESSEIWDKHLALFQLEQLRNFWIQNRTYKWDDHSFKYQIKFMYNHYEILALKCVRNFLTFPTRKMAEEFLNCFRDLIEKAGDLI